MNIQRVNRRGVLRSAGLAVAGPAISRFGLIDEAAGQTLSVEIVNTDSNSTRTLQALLRAKGWLEEQGLVARTQNVSDGSKLMGALISGSSDICMLSGFGQVLAAVEKGGRLKVVAGAGVVPFQAMFTKRSDIRTMKDLEGKTIGTGSLGALLHQTVVALLEKKGVDTKKVNFVNVGSSADVFRAIVAGTVDAGPGLYDVYNQQQKYGVHALSDGEFWTELREYVYQGSYASDKAIAEKRDSLVRLLAAYAKLYRFISSHDSLDDYIRARQEALGGDAKLAAEEATSEWGFIQREQPYAKNLVLTEEQLRFMQKLNIKTGSQTKVLPFQQVADMSIALDAVKRLG